MTALTPAQRKAAERNRQRELGRVVVQVWIHPDDRERLTKYVERLNRKRGDKW